ncbi:hypothetical protein A2803_00375 [Candidatus Woesebacteria bacterium RIFCSPHIGHO2_01_FULL_44_21]|uniref:Dephospho-CoA kinase n=1 Tax=Candidatus Woesebacteria bacterium RIFCSPHIGHO2_01_FULL_44_21 TaxID=1802503 RepID=A0A1F7YW92_9BACT|nr:MAG: hypothetical protein A2803_00375 [Candidatus Woesebacteria bacterium RIFCSPHIGHO2_01_FULL_44_21]OGM68925.1 MAG: hypothetical protein A2897_02070 [Candidatus Woesebacteria bacterium RIFCSPLOWO2_01_FULL_44_24b]
MKKNKQSLFLRNKIICITGMPGAGKTLASEFFIKKGMLHLRFGQAVLDYLIKKGLTVNEKNERKIREYLRKKHGMAAMAILNLPKLKALKQKGPVIADGLYSFDEFLILKKQFKQNIVVISVYAPPHMRYERLAQRKLIAGDKRVVNRPLTRSEAESRDLAELKNLDKGGTIAMSDYTVLNTKSISFLNKQLNEIYKKIS